MAVKTTFSKKDFGKIISNYNLEEIKNFTPFKLGAVQTNLLLETEKDKLVFRYYESRSKRYALFEVNVLQYLARHSYPCPAPIRNNHGSFIGKHKDKPFALFEFMEGEHKKDINPKLIAQAIGKLHKITAGYKPKYFQARDSYDPKSCWENAISNSKKIKSKAEAKKRLDWLKSELEKLKLPNNLPKGVCHCDTHPSNFLHKNHEISAVLDFDDASYIPLLYDVANMLYFWAWPPGKELDLKKARELLKEYCKYRKLNENEKRRLFDYLKMVDFMSVGWFIHDDSDFRSDKKRLEHLNSIGRQEFYHNLF
ncbi:MAG: homoserine kinase [Candidatus Moranbacteria bacterium]|nr:homoserine kinase [Candidatus Moranbacteria bacterium]